MNRTNKAIICILLIFCLMFSACAGTVKPSDLDEFLKGEEEFEDVINTPEPTPEITESPIELRDDFGVVSLNSTEEILQTYYGITFEESGSAEPIFTEVSSQYEFGEIVYGVTVDNSGAMFSGSALVIASITAFDPLGNSLSKGITSNMTSTNRKKYFGSDSYAHALAITYPGTYYVRYEITVKEPAESFVGQEYQSQTLTYYVDKIYTIEKVDAYVSAESDFYFVKTQGADVYDDADIVITTVDGWDISDEVIEDIYNSSRIELYVPKITAETSVANVYTLDVVGKKSGVDVSDEEISSKYFNLIIEDGKRYIIPAEDEYYVSTFYETLAGLGIDNKMSEYDFSIWEEYISAYNSYVNLSETQKMLFDLYPTYLIKYDDNFSYTDYYNMRACHDWLLKIACDVGRVELGYELEDIVSSYESGDATFESLAEYLISLSGNGVYIASIIKSGEEYHYSDLEFAVKYAFDGKYENGENGYVDLLIEEEQASFADTSTQINKWIYGEEKQLEMEIASLNILVSIISGDKNSALDLGGEYYALYKDCEGLLGEDEYSSYVLDVIEKYMTFEYSEKYSEYESQATDALLSYDVLDEEIFYAFSILRECLNDTYANLLPSQITQEIKSSYKLSIALCENFMLRVSAYEAVATTEGAREYLEENLMIETENGSILIYDYENAVGNIAGSGNIGSILTNCSILNLQSARDVFASEIADFLQSC